MGLSICVTHFVKLFGDLCVGSHFLFAYFNGSQFIANKFVAKSLEQGRGVANSARVANFYLAK